MKKPKESLSRLVLFEKKPKPFYVIINPLIYSSHDYDSKSSPWYTHWCVEIAKFKVRNCLDESEMKGTRRINFTDYLKVVAGSYENCVINKKDIIRIKNDFF